MSVAIQLQPARAKRLKIAQVATSDISVRLLLLEQIEALEQLRALAHGVKIKVVEACSSSTGVDTAADLERVRELVGATS